MKKLGLFIAFSFFFAIGMMAQSPQSAKAKKDPKPTTTATKSTAVAKNSGAKTTVSGKKKPVRSVAAKPKPAPQATISRMK